MELKIFFTIFAAIFVAELGDKTQLATLLFASDKEVSKFTVFFASSAALVVASKLLRNNCISVNIWPINRYNNTFDLSKFFHSL